MARMLQTQAQGGPPAKSGKKVRRYFLQNAASQKVTAYLFAGLLLLTASIAQAQTTKPPPDYQKQPKAPSRPIMEISAMGNISRSDYGNGSYSKSQRFTASVGLFITATTELEVNYSDSRSLYKSEPAPKTTTRSWDRSAGVTLSQSLLPRRFFFSPYIKAGAAQLNRRQQVTYNGTEQPETVLKQPSGVAGAGFRLNVASFMSLKLELNTFMPNFNVREAKKNYDWEAGISFIF